MACLGICLLNDPYLTPSSEESQYIYGKLISEVGCFDVSYSSKMYVFVVCEIVKRYSAIVDFELEKLFALFRSVVHLLVIGYEKERNNLEEMSLIKQHS